VLAVASRTTAGTMYSLFNREGKPLSATPAPLTNPSVDLSRDGASLAVVRDNDLWIRDLVRDTETRFTTSTNQDLIGIWSPDGKQIAYVSRRGAGNIAGLYLKPSNGTTAEQPLLELERSIYANDWSRDGRFLIYADSVTNTNMDLSYLPMDAPKDSRKPTTYLQEPFNQKQAQFSPDGRFVAYASDESGNFEIYVRPFPDASTGKWTVSAGGGVEPRWNKDGTELYYFSGRKLMAVAVKTAGGFSMGTPKELFEAPVEVGYSNDSHHWQVAPDGRFLIVTFTESATSVITVITNWQELLKQ
jgi:Tol biopolymer transport system component